jgi:hypothetical protein
LCYLPLLLFFFSSLNSIILSTNCCDTGINSVRCRFRFSPPVAPLSPLCDYKAPLPPHPHCILPSTLFCHRSLLSSLTDQAAQPPEFSPRDVAGLTWSPLSIPPPNRLVTLIRPFLESNFPRRWSDSDVGADAWPGQPGRSLPNPVPDPLSSSLLFPSASLNGLLSGLSRFLPLQASKMPHHHGHSPRL